MPKIVVTAAVKNVEGWLKFKPEMIAQLSAVASDGTSYVAMDGSNHVASTWDVPDMEAFQAAQTASLARDGGGDGAVRDDPAGDDLRQEVARPKEPGGATPRGSRGAPRSARSLEVTMMLANSLAVTSLVLTDVDRAKKFYAEQLGPMLLEETPFSCRFGAGKGSQLTVRLVSG